MGSIKIVNGKWSFSKDIPMNNITKDGIFFCSTKKEAVAFAKAHGWFVKDVDRGCNRWCNFWFVRQMTSPTRVRIIRFDGTVEEADISA